jgi:hypothetical protein
MVDRRITAIAAVAVALALSGASVTPAAAQSITDRFKSLFGGKSEEPAPGAPAVQDPALSDNQVEDNCPPVSIRAGASTFAVAAPGKQAIGNDVRFQASIVKTARECRKSGGEITARIGIHGRVIAGPAGAPSTVEIPMRVAVVQGGVGEKVIATKAYRTTVEMSEDGNSPFTLVAEDVVYPVPSVSTADAYVFYIGFDPQALGSEPKAKPAKKKK